MNRFKKAVSLLLALTMLIGLLPTAAFASSPSEEDSSIYTIQNDYVKYSINAETGGFSIETLDGNPQKELDDNIPLLYKEDEDRSNGTSFATIRIDGRDYIFGRSYGFYGIATELHTPVVSNEGRLITVQWDIRDISVIQEVALSAEADQDLTGNVGISYTVINNGRRASTVGIRVLLDTALDSTEDAPYLIADTDTIPITAETEFSRADGTMPNQIRGVDSLNNPSKMLYTFTKTWNTEASEVDRVIVGHWRNLANTRYVYTPDEYCNFTNYSNSHRFPDSAIAYYWDEGALEAGASRVAEVLYGVGNFSQSVEKEGIGLNMSLDNKVRLNAEGTGYVNNGEFDVTVVIDNSVTGAQLIEGAVLRLSFEDGVSSVDGIVTQAFDTIEIGDVKTLRFHLKAEKQNTITARTIGVTLTGTQGIDESKARVVTLNTQRSIIVPGVKGVCSDIQVSSIAPEIVFTEGTKTITVTGELSPLKAIEGSDGWNLFLFHTTTDHKVEIEKSRIAFLNDECTQLSISTDEELSVGNYEIGFEFTDTQLVQGFGVTALRLAKTVQVSNNPIYRSRTYGLMALIRYNQKEYAFVPFSDQEEYNNFLDGLGRDGKAYSDRARNGYPDINGKMIAPFDPVDENNPETMLLNDKEVILIMRGSFRETTAEDGSSFYQASSNDADIIINEILKYTGEKPLVIKESNGIYTVSGDGKLSVISSIEVWSRKWSFQVNSGTVTTLDSDRCLLSGANELSLTLGGVGYMVQSLGGFLIDIKYGIMSSNRPVDSDRTLIYSISFGGSISIPISIPDSKKDDGNQGDSGKKDDAQNLIKTADDEEDYSDALHNLFGEEDESGSGVGNGIVGGSTGIGTKPSTSKPETDFKKDTNLDEGLLSAAINDVRFGQEAEETKDGVKITDIGFIGIDATLSLGLPKDILGSLVSNAPGVYASLTINTIDHFYMLEAGLDIKMIQCEGVLSFAMTEVKDVEVVVPDSIQFYIRDGLKIPLVPPVLYISGLGGGIDGLADTIGGEFSKLPPITLLLFTRLDLVELMVGDFNASIALTGISVSGDFSINVAGIMESKPSGGGNTGGGTGGNTGTNGAKDSPKNPAHRNDFTNTVINVLKSPATLSIGASMRWVDPVTFNAYGNISVIQGLLSGGVSITIAKESFYGYAYLTLCIPESIPIVGGREVAGVEAAITEKFIGANIKIIGIKLGFIYYWDGDFSVGSGINLRSMPGVSYPEYNTNAVFATNLTKLEKSEARTRSIGTLVYNLSVSGQDSIVLEIPFEGNVLPTVDDLTVTNPSGRQIPLVADDGNGNGNFLVQAREDGSYIYISVTDADLIEDGNWSVQVQNAEFTVGTFDAFGVEDIPEITDIMVTRSGDISSYDVQLDWTLDGSSTGSGYLDVYLTRDVKLLEKIRSSDTEQQDIVALDRIRLDHVASGSRSVTIPDSMDSGTYYVAAMLTNDVGGISTVISGTTFEFVNSKLPKSVEGVEVGYAGDGELYVEIADAGEIDYTHYLVEVVAEDGSTLTNHIGEFEVGETIYIGAEANLTPGRNYYVAVKTLRSEEGDKYYYGTETVASSAITMPALDKPVLLSVETNVQNGTTGEGVLEITYTFDREVWMYVEINERTLNATKFSNTWTFTHELNDGDFTVDFRAYGKNKDSVTGADFPDIENAQMGFTVDTVAPSLSLKEESYKTLALDDDGEVTASFGSTVVFADADGNFVIEGITDYDATLTAEGNVVTVGNNGEFSYTGKLDTDEFSREITLRAVDDAGNFAEIAVFAVRGDQPVFEFVEILFNGEVVERNSDGEAVVTVTVGASAELTLVGITAAGDQVVIEDAIWEILYEKNLIGFDNGDFTAKMSGETAVKAGMLQATATLANGKQEDVLLESYVVIVIEKGTKGALLDAILAAEENLQDTGAADEDAIDAYSDAIEAAKAVYNDETATEDDVAQAIAALAVATAAFNEAKNEMVVDKTALYNAIVAAEKNIANPMQASWSAIAAYRAAIDAATAVLEDADATDAEVQSAIETLNQATKEFDQAKSGGSGGEIIQPQLHFVAVGDTVNGTVSVSQRMVWHGTSLTITSVPDTGYVIESVVINGVNYGSESVITIPRVTSDLSIVVTFVDGWEAPFADVCESDWYYEPVRWANINGIIKGMSEDTFGPKVPLLRAMLVTILWRIEGCPDVDHEIGFTDVPADDYYTEAVAWAELNGIVTGYSADKFGPMDKITREQFATIVYRYAVYKERDVAIGEDDCFEGYTDANQISPYAVTAMRYAVEKGLIKGRTTTELAPRGDTSRAEAVMILFRYFTELQ